MEYGSEQIYQEENIDIKKFLFRILSNWYWFALALFITITSAYLISRYSEPIYSVNATVMVMAMGTVGYGQGYYSDENDTSKNIFKKIRRVLFGKRSG